MPKVPYMLATQYQFYVQDGMLRIAFGDNDAFHLGVAINSELAVDLLSQVGGIIRDQIRTEMGVTNDEKANAIRSH